MNSLAKWVIALGSALACVASGPASAHPPYSLVEDRAANVYFSDLEAVWRLGPDGRVTLFRPPTEGTHVHELALGADGALTGDLVSYDPGTQTYHAAIWRRTPAGEERWVVGPTTAPPKGAGLAQDAAGNRYLAQWVNSGDRRTMLFRRTPRGKVELLLGPRREAAEFRQVLLSSVGGMAFPEEGGLVFADGRALRRLVRGDRVSTLYEGPEGSSLRGVAALADGRILVADMGRRMVLAVSRHGKAETLYREEGPWLPTAASMSLGRLLVLEANADPYDYVNRVRVIEVRGGKRRVLAAPGAPRPAAKEDLPNARGSGGFGLLAAAVAVGAAGTVFWLRRRGDGAAGPR